MKSEYCETGKEVAGDANSDMFYPIVHSGILGLGSICSILYVYFYQSNQILKRQKFRQSSTYMPYS